MKKYLGIDIGGTSVKIGIVNEKGEVLNPSEYSVAFDKYETPILTTVLKSTDIFLNENNISISSLSGIGISATGQINTFSGSVAGTGGNIKNWAGSKIKDEFESKYKLPTTVVNDANCVALAEKWVGAATNAKNFIVITIGTGLGGGILVNDNILLGHFGFAGELGHFSINNEGRACTCGNKGCYEQYASMTALVKDVKKFYEENNIKTDTEINGRYIFTELKNGNTYIENIVNTWIDNIVAGIVSLVHIFNPEMFIIGGGVSTQEDLFISKVREKAMQKIMPNFAKNFELNAAKLGNNAGLVGAVYYLIQSLN